MTPQRIQVELTHRVHFTEHVFDPANPVLGQLMCVDGESPRKVMVVVDRDVAEAWPQLTTLIEAYFDQIDQTLVDEGASNQHAVGLPELVGFRTVPGGEESKNDLGFLEGLLGDINRTGLCRRSYILAIGGGAVLDMTRFAAAISHRGIRCIGLPTTTLAQADAGIGVKNGVNMFGKKNFIGTFAVPWAVVNDAAWLQTLTDRDWRAGLSEAVKVALLKDAGFFDELERHAAKLRQRDQGLGQQVWQRCARLHVDHIVHGGDPFEDRQARPLDFGHWAAHKLEQESNFDLRHGEAVAIGLAIDVTYSRLMGLLDDPGAQRVLTTLQRMGFKLDHEFLDQTDTLLEGLEEFREHLGGQLTITLIQGISQPLEVHHIDRPTMRRAIGQLRHPVARLGGVVGV